MSSESSESEGSESPSFWKSLIIVAGAIGVAAGLLGFLLIVSAQAYTHVVEKYDDIAELESVSVEQVESGGKTFCAVNYNITKDEGVILQFKRDGLWEFYGNGEYFYQHETEVDDFLLFSAGKPTTIEINAYEEPDGGAGESLQLWSAEIGKDCSR